MPFETGYQPVFLYQYIMGFESLPVLTIASFEIHVFRTKANAMRRFWENSIFKTVPNFPSIESILPHRDPAIVVDRILSCDNDAIRCERKVRADEHYGSGLSCEGIIEFCAQAAICKETVCSAGSPKMGVIAGIDEFQFFSNAVAGDVLVAEIATRTKLGALCLFECTVLRENEKIAHGFIKAALT
jgi:predicted hotdog family 3-hydroxylacyl-ACP dehydratase